MQSSSSQEIDCAQASARPGEFEMPDGKTRYDEHTTKQMPSWRDVKAELESFDRAGLLRLLKDLHEVSTDNQAFLNARFALGEAPLVPYKKLISRWIAPDVMKGQDVSVAKAKKAISNYKKAIDIRKASPNSREQTVGLLLWSEMDDESYYAALVRMFNQALITICGLPEAERASFLERLNQLRSKASQFGWEVNDAFDESWFTVMQ